ncbi:MAG: FprA family A-type flavoprotein, partial [Thermoplasmata archaeon]|nr:FprA family A-type flavoprotein [Thermoplasmata archaeon]
MEKSTPMGTISIAPNVFWVGIKHHNRRLFDSLIPLPHGTSYNAYLVIGSEKTALIDSVNPGFENDLFAKISQHTDISKLDYVVMNHAEPDHANACQFVLKKAPNAKLLTSKKGKEAALIYFDIDESRIQVVDEATEIKMGGKTLKFVDAPWLHWPETIFTYLVEDGILFPCDFFGQHLALGEFYADELGNEVTVDYAKMYFAEIMMPFRKPCLNAIEKVKKLNPKIIAPSHGVIYRDPKMIISAYEDWAGEKMKKKVLIPYVTMWGSTEKMVNILAEALVKKGIEVVIYDLPNSNVGHVAKDMIDSPVVVVGGPTVLGGVHPSAAYATMLVKALRAPTKYAAVLTSHGWSGGAVKAIQELLSGTKIEILGAVDAKGKPTEKDIEA